MPTLSPHPPAQANSPADKAATPGEAPKSTGSASSPQPQSSGDPNRTSDGSSTTTNPTPAVNLKRPVLTSKEYENAVLEEEQTLDLLYDYSTLDAWYVQYICTRLSPGSVAHVYLHIDYVVG